MKSFPFLKQRPRLVVQIRYLNIILIAFNWTSIGSFWNLAHKHTLNMILGMGRVKYNNDHFIALYWVLLTFVNSSCSPRYVVGCIRVFISLTLSMLNFFKSSFAYLIWWTYIPLFVWSKFQGRTSILLSCSF